MGWVPGGEGADEDPTLKHGGGTPVGRGPETPWPYLAHLVPWEKLALFPAQGDQGPGEAAGTVGTSAATGAQPGPLWHGLKPGDNVHCREGKCGPLAWLSWSQGPWWSGQACPPQVVPTLLLDGSGNLPGPHPHRQSLRGEEGGENSLKQSPACHGLIFNAQGLRELEGFSTQILWGVGKCGQLVP